VITLSYEVEGCPECGGPVEETVVYADVADLHPPPRQVERYVRVEWWQCLRVGGHYGEVRTPVDERPLPPCAALHVHSARCGPPYDVPT